MQRRFSRPRFGNRDMVRGFEKPVKLGETYDVEINEVGSRGDGIARVKNFVIFVPNVKKGDKCKIKITQVRRRFATGEKVGEAEVAEEPEKKEEKVEKKEEKKPEEEEKKVEEVTEKESKEKSLEKEESKLEDK